MDQEQIFSIKPSTKLITFKAIKNIGLFILFTIVLLILRNLISKVFAMPNIFGPIATIAFIITIFIVIKDYIKISTTYYTLYEKSFVVQTGFFTVKRENLENYRIVDISSSQSFLYRMLGIGTVTLHTIDRSDPTLILDGIDNYIEIEKKFKEYSAKKRPTVIEAYTGDAGDIDHAPGISD
ncbi:MAG: PH domain-containing protein [archaeon]|nr:PH domain-containing protein [archaeon]